MTSPTDKYRKATPAENLRILAARLSEHLSPAEKRGLEEAACLLSAERDSGLIAELRRRASGDTDSSDVELLHRAADALERIPSHVGDIKQDFGPWRVVQETSCTNILSDDFTHDVCLSVHGDFANPDQRHTYAQDIARRLCTPSAIGDIERDAARYRWLRNHPVQQFTPEEEKEWWPSVWLKGATKPLQAFFLDDEVDAAMRRTDSRNQPSQGDIGEP